MSLGGSNTPSFLQPSMPPGGAREERLVVPPEVSKRRRLGGEIEAVLPRVWKLRRFILSSFKGPFLGCEKKGFKRPQLKRGLLLFRLFFLGFWKVNPNLGSFFGVFLFWKFGCVDWLWGVEADFRKTLEIAFWSCWSLPFLALFLLCVGLSAKLIFELLFFALVIIYIYICSPPPP